MNTKLYKFLLIGIFIFAFISMIISAKADSLTTDEGIHLFAGYTYLTKNDFRLDPEHPPLLKEISALPLLFYKDLKVPIDGLWDKAGNFYYDSWQEARLLSNNFLFDQGNDTAKIIFWGRFPFIILTLILGLITYLWAQNLYGQKAGIFGAFLILLMPNILAHGRLINTDLGLTFFLFITIYFWTNFLKKPKFLNGFLSGIFLGLTFASKFTSVIVIPIIIILALVKIIFLKNEPKAVIKIIGGFFPILAIAFLILWATYGFSTKVSPISIDSLSANINLWTGFHLPDSFDKISNQLRPVMFPADYYKGFFLVGRHAFTGHGAYLLGKTSNTGWWYYFPVAIFYKTPVAFFIFLILAFVIFYKKVKPKISFDEIVLLSTPIIYLLFSMFSKADLGVRHVLPIFPFLIVFASRSINLFNFNKIGHLIIFGLLILWYLFSNVLIYPNYLAYFNEFAGGSKNGYKILGDSNLDWGQDAYRIKKYLLDNKISDGYILYPWNGDEALKYYGINLKSMSLGEFDLKGVAIVSATYYQLGEMRWLDKYQKEEITSGVFTFYGTD